MSMAGTLSLRRALQSGDVFAEGLTSEALRFRSREYGFCSSSEVGRQAPPVNAGKPDC